MRVIAFLTTFVFTVVNTSWAQPLIPVSLVRTPSLSGFDPKAIEIPKELGSIEIRSSSSKGGGSLVILLQDAHAILDAQDRIQRLIHHFQARYGISLIALEGACRQT